MAGRRSDRGARGFPPDVLIFLDQEEGGRLLPEQAAYLFAWIDAVRGAGARAGVDCSGIAAPGGDVRSARRRILPSGRTRECLRITPPKAKARMVGWRFGLRMPMSARTGLRACRPAVGRGGFSGDSAFATVWQYAQSPRRTKFSAGCPANQAADGNCYAPGCPQREHLWTWTRRTPPTPPRRPLRSPWRGGSPAPMTGFSSPPPGEAG